MSDGGGGAACTLSVLIVWLVVSVPPVVTAPPPSALANFCGECSTREAQCAAQHGVMFLLLLRFAFIVKSMEANTTEKNLFDMCLCVKEHPCPYRWLLPLPFHLLPQFTSPLTQFATRRVFFFVKFLILLNGAHIRTCVSSVS